MKRKVLLLMTSRYAIYEMIAENLEKMGYEVSYMGLRYFKYESFWQRLHNFFRKTFLNDREFKNTLRQKQIEKNILNLSQNGSTEYDFALVIKPDDFNLETIQFLKKISKKVIGYHWDGFSRFNIELEMIDTFDVFGVFDKSDYDEKSKSHINLVKTQNFFFDILPIPEKEIDLFYIGVCQDDRLNKLNHLADIIKGTEISYDFNLYFEKDKQNIPFNRVEELLSYKDVLGMSSKARAVIDLKFPLHNGLSLRFFEALYFNQKIITDNKTAKETDFYHPNNILVVDDFEHLKQEELSDFLAKEYVEISKDIKQKYSFENWFNSMISA